MGRSILFVDDEKAILKCLKRSFMDCEYDTYFAESGREALLIFESNHIDLVVSDMRMPYMDGRTLLKTIKEKYPDTLRLILSGDAGKNEVIKALVDGSAIIYLVKPWNHEDLVKTIAGLFETRASLADHKLGALIMDMEKVPTHPVIYKKFCQLLDQDADTKEFTSLIESDPVISAKLLHIANSAFYGIKTGSVQQALVYLGVGAVKSIVLATSILDSLGIKGTSFSKTDFWRHMSLSNKIVSLLYERVFKKKLAQDCASAGLLHDIGEIILFHQYEQELSAAIGKAPNLEEESLCILERKMIGFSHQEIGGYLLSWWGLPFSIVEAALYHHNPFDMAVHNQELVKAVHIAGYYAWVLLGREDWAAVDDQVFEHIGITKAACDDLIRQFITVGEGELL